jgi:peptidoglycan/LPS O-acetylase OafA/YrhL
LKSLLIEFSQNLNKILSMKFQAAVFTRHVCQSTAACATAMSRGDISTFNLEHWQEALSTGASVGLLAVIFTFGSLKKVQSSRWGIAGIAFVATVIADFFMDHSNYGGLIGEPLVTGLGAALLSLLLSSTALGNFLEKLETA